MNKTKLQELCHKLHWEKPDYNHRRMGPDHDARYDASVTVNGHVFDSSDAESKSSKEACNKAAGVALESLSVIAYPTISPRPPVTANTPAVAELQSLSSRSSQTENTMKFKSELHMYAQKRSIELPKYTAIRDGTAHLPLFKSIVAINGQDFESPKYFHSLKEAEHAAAEVALSNLPKEEKTPLLNVPDRVSGSLNYKTMVQEILQKEKKLLPVYVTVNDPKSITIPMFSSTVEIDGLSFKGDEAKSKKQAESNAAKIALQYLKDRKRMPISSGPSSPSSTRVSMNNSLRSCSSSNDNLNNSKPKPTSNNESASLSSSIWTPKQDKVVTGNDNSAPLESPKPEPIKIAQTQNIDPIENTNSSSITSDESTKTVSTEIESAVSEGQSGLSDNGPVSAMKNENGNGESVEPSLLSHRIQVFPRKPDLVLPPGASLLPCSDDQWVAVELDNQNQGSNGAHASVSVD